MNTRGDRIAGGLVAFAVDFNSTRTCFAIAHDEGFSVYRLIDGEKLSSSKTTALKYAAMVLESRYVAIASLFGRQSGSTTFDVGIYDSGSASMVITEDIRHVRSVRVTEERMIVVGHTALYLYDTDGFQRLTTLETTANELGTCAVGATRVVAPGRSPGQVQVVDLKSGRAQQIISAHQSAIRAIDISEDERYVVTASETGTLFRIFLLSDSNSTKVAELRRGIEATRILSIRMSPDNAYLAVTSEKGTLHIFSLAANEPSESENAYASTSRVSNSPEPVSIKFPPRSGSLSTSPGKSIRRGGASLLSGSPPTKLSSTMPLAGSPAEYVMVDASMPAAKEYARSGSSKSGQKYGKLSRLPVSVLQGHYPDATTRFSVGDINAAAQYQSMLGVPTRGQIKWLDEDTFVVVRVQPTSFWEKFKVGRDPFEGHLEVARLAYVDLSIP